MKGTKHRKTKQIFALLLVAVLFLQSGIAYGAPEASEQEVYETGHSDGSLAGKTINFVNLYWETNDLGAVEAVFTGGAQDEAVAEMTKKDRGLYETTIPEGDYARVAFRQKGTEELLEPWCDFYGETKASENLTVTNYEEDENNTFYYDMGENPSYWGASPSYEQPAEAAAAVREDEQNPTPGDMLYVVDMNVIENPAASSAERINIAFLEKGHDKDDPMKQGEGYTMYELRNGVYVAPFPETVDQYAEVAFQLVNSDGENSWMSRHYNFRGEIDTTETFGYFTYIKGAMDTFYLNVDPTAALSQDASYWGAHPGRADDSLDTEVCYVDVTDYTGNGIVADLEDLWISWDGMKGTMQGGEYVPGKGYRIKNVLAKENARYFQFPYSSQVTENDVITLQFSLKALNGELPEEYKGKTFAYKFMLIPRSGKNCLQIDHIWEFNGQMWTTFEVGEIKERSIFFENNRTKYERLQMRLAMQGDDGSWQHMTKTELSEIYGWTQEQIEQSLEESADGTVWLNLESVAETEYDKQNLWRLMVPSAYTHVQFRGVKQGAWWYSNHEEISTTLSYPCYYASQQGGSSAAVPDEDVAEPGIKGFWRSVHSADTSGDQSIDIPEDTFEKEEDTYYIDTTFYDYYSDWELQGNKQKDYVSPSDDVWRHQGDVFNEVLQSYYQTEFQEVQKRPENQLTAVKPIYLTNEMKALNASQAWWLSGKGQNQWTKEGGGPYQGAVDGKLTDGTFTFGATDQYEGVAMPFFDENFLRGDNSLDTAIGNVYKNVQFPFQKDENKDSRTRGYWVFNSANAEDSVRMSYDVNEGYFLKRTNQPILFRSRNSFFPFTDAGLFSGESEGKKHQIDYLFGTRFDLDFRLTEDAQIYNAYTQKDEPIRFEFQGDDDAWVFVDGILALDMGGLHDAVRGEINFQDGTYTIWRDIGKSDHTYDGDGIVDKTGKLPEELLEKLKDKEGSHTLTMFYMERGQYESNLKVSFNFPRQSTFEVEKEVDLTSKLTDPQGGNVFTDLLENMGSFQFHLENLVTSGEKLAVEDSAGYISPKERKPLYNAETEADFAFAEGKGTVKKDGNVYKVEQSGNVSGTETDVDEMLKITPKEKLNVKGSSYLRLAMRNEGVNDVNAKNLYLAFEDAKGNRVGGYAGALGYDGETPTFIKGEESIIRVDYRQMTGRKSFDWSKVAAMYIGIRREKETDIAAYAVSSIVFIESVNEVQKNGFSVDDSQISDYGSYESGVLTPIDKAWYIRQNRKEDGKYDAGVSRQTDKGEFSLAAGQKAVFVDKFRTGSYLALREEEVNPKVFDSEWTILENGQEVDANYLLTTRNDVVSLKNPMDIITADTLYPLSHVPGTEVGDKRTENISNDWPNKDKIKVPDTSSGKTMVYRGYADPDGTSNIATDLGVRVKNTLKYGSITIEKKLTDTMLNSDTGKYIPGDYVFDIYYTNIAGLNLESQMIPVDGQRYLSQTVQVHVDESGTGKTVVPNIPAGTQYYIVERPTNGADLQGVEIGPEWTNPAVEAPHEKVELVGVKEEEGKEDYSQAYVKGTAYASNQTFTFTNEVRPFYMDIQKVWRDDLTDEEREKLGFTEVHIKLQRRIQGTEDEWETVTKDYFGEKFVEEGGYIVLTKKNDWKMTSIKELPVKSEDNRLYEYQIEELNYQGILNSYQVSYDEIRNPDKDGYMHVTYRATNRPAGLLLMKNWDDEEDVGGIRPEKIRVKLLASSQWNPEDPDQEVTWICYKKLTDPKHECDQDDSCYIELEEGNAWKASVEFQKIADDEGQPYYYKMAQEQIYRNGKWVDVGEEGLGLSHEYCPEYGEPVLPNGSMTEVVSVTNRIPLGNITILKKSKEEDKVLPDAEFVLERLVSEEGVPDEKLKVDESFEKRTAATSDLGRIEFKKLPYGKYKITETKSPKGYVLLKSPVYITLDEQAFESQAEQHEGDLSYDPASKTITVTILNEAGLHLPITGGRGLLWFTMAGFVLIGTGMLLYIRRKRNLRCVKNVVKNKE